MISRRIALPLFLFVLLAGTWSLTWALPAVSSPGAELNPFIVRHAAVNVEVINHLIRTTVVQQIYNDSEKDVPCSFDIPLPEGARASAFSAVVDGKEYIGKIVRRSVARKIVDEARKQNVAAAFAEESDGKLHVELSQVKAKQEFAFRISYIEQAQYKKGAFHYYFGVVRNNREMPNPDMFTMSIYFEATAGLKSVESDTHKINGHIDGNKGTYEVEDIGRGKVDFHMSYVLNLTPGHPHIMLKDVAGEDPYFSLLMLPPDIPLIDKGRSIVFILDKSGSMGGTKFPLAVKALEHFINRLNDNDLVNVLIFDTTTVSCSPFPFLADSEGKKAAIEFTNKYRAGGGTRFLEPLVNSIKSLMLDKEHIPAVVLLTDGEDNVDGPLQFVNAVDAISKFKVPIFTFAIGSDLNFALLRALAEYSGASLGHIVNDEDMIPALSKVADKFDRLLAHSVKIETEGSVGYQRYPLRLSGLYADEPVVIYGRLNDAGTIKMMISASSPFGEWFETFNLSTLGERTDCDFLDAMWGAKRISALIDQTSIFGVKEQVKNEIISLSYRYLLTSPYTSLVFSEVEMNIPDEEQIEEELEDDERGSYVGGYTGGKGGALRRTSRAGGVAAPNSQAPADSKAEESKAQDRGKDKALPMFNDKFEIVDAQGNLLADQLRAHLYALAFSIGSKANTDQAQITNCSKWLMERGGMDTLTDLADLLAAAYSLSLIPQPSTQIEAAKKSVLDAISNYDASTIKSLKAEAIALSAFFAAKLVESGIALPDALIAELKSVLIATAGFSPTDSPSGKNLAFMSRWLEWFPIFASCGKGLGIKMPQPDAVKTMLELSTTSASRSQTVKPNIAYILAFTSHIRSGLIKDDAAAKAAELVSQEINTANAMKADARTSAVHIVLGDRFSEAISPLFR